MSEKTYVITMVELAHYLRRFNWDIITLAESYLILNSDGDTIAEHKKLSEAIKLAIESQKLFTPKENSLALT